MQILLDEGNTILAYCTVGGFDGGIEVEDIPAEVQTAPMGFYKYVDNTFVINPDYKEPEKEPTQEDFNLDIDFRLALLELGL